MSQTKSTIVQLLNKNLRGPHFILATIKPLIPDKFAVNVKVDKIIEDSKQNRFIAKKIKNKHVNIIYQLHDDDYDVIKTQTIIESPNK